MKKCSVSLIIKEMQIKMRMRYSLTCQIGYYQKNKGQQALVRMWRIWNSCTMLVGIQNGTAAVEIYMEVPQKIQNRTTMHPAIPFLVNYPKELKSGAQIGIQFSSVSQSCPTLCDPMNRGMPGLPVHHQLPEFAQTHAH